MHDTALSPTPPVTASRTARAARFAALEWIRENTNRRAAKSCMFAVNGGVTIGATSDGTTHTRGTKRCASPWSCSVCAPTIAHTRAREIDLAVLEHTANGGTVFMVTGTLAHSLGDDLAPLLEQVQLSWSHAWRWQAPYTSRLTGLVTNADKVRPAWYQGQVRTLEITHGANGWHPHVHALVFVRADGDLEEAERWLRHEARRRWGVAVTKHGGTTDVRSSRSPGWNVRTVFGGAVGPYLTKVEGGWSAGSEIAKADQKRKGVTPWALLQQAVNGDQAAGKLFKVYDLATRGHRRIVASPGLMSMVEDEDAALEQLEDDPVVVVQVRADVWRKLLRTRQAARLLSDVSDLAAGRLEGGWSWPSSWLV